MKVLITGGAGFIGTHLARHLLRVGCEVSVLDSFSPQVHGKVRDLPPDLAGDVTLHRTDIRNSDLLQHALRGQNVVVHLAAETGTGQSMYEVNRYEAVNIGGTANLMHLLVNDSSRTVSKLIVASSRAVYGEGRYHCSQDGVVFPVNRRIEDLRAGQYVPRCPHCDQPCEALPTSEDSPFHPTSFYGLTKQVQEQMVLMFAGIMGMAAFAIRYQNVFGPGQSLNNPYTGILAIFANQARTNQTIHVFEDGHQSRDFVYIEDVVEATWRCILSPESSSQALNVGSGVRTTVSQVAQEIVSILGSSSKVEIDGSFRAGDIRHNCAETAKAKSLIGFEARWKFCDGLREFLRWAQSQEVAASRYELSLLESRERGVLHA